ncbi:uncharacterized protein LOC113305507 [Papaver somniferum]|uniref:uncharacterized protein LOC113305507 n=1 Tax=Papaver somniferum TaxID=3469 RepID=UPI000E6FEB5E|nr:uncharacterized protein LOC113305507 [Papaver somniferum]
MLQTFISYLTELKGTRRRLQGKKLIVAVDDDGYFTDKVSHFCGRYVKDADKDIINDVKTAFEFSTRCSTYNRKTSTERKRISKKRISKESLCLSGDTCGLTDKYICGITYIINRCTLVMFA